MNLLKKIDDVITKLFFSRLWSLVDIMVILNICVYCYELDVSVGGVCGTGIAMMIMVFIYYLICDQIRLSYRISVLENIEKLKK